MTFGKNSKLLSSSNSLNTKLDRPNSIQREEINLVLEK
jgi:hypothetical protein